MTPQNPNSPQKHRRRQRRSRGQAAEVGKSSRRAAGTRDSTDEATQAVQLLARAYGYGGALEMVVGRHDLAGAPWDPSGDESNPAINAGLAIAHDTETLIQAGRAINDKDRRQAQLLTKATAEHRADAIAWSDTHNLRSTGGGKPHRTREFDHWKRVAGIAYVPIKGPAEQAVTALVDAQLAGPMPHLVLFAATHDARHWLKVLPYLLACGHPAWACREIEAEFYGAATTIAAGARAVGIRAEAWRQETNRVRSRIDDWLARAGRPILDMRDRYRYRHSFRYGDLTGIRSETWWRPVKKPAPRTCSHREWRGHDAVDYCHAFPSHPGIRASVGSDHPVRTKLAFKSRVAALEEDGYADPQEVEEVRF